MSTPKQTMTVIPPPHTRLINRVHVSSAAVGTAVLGIPLLTLFASLWSHEPEINYVLVFVIVHVRCCPALMVPTQSPENEGRKERGTKTSRTTKSPGFTVTD